MLAEVMVLGLSGNHGMHDTGKLVSAGHNGNLRSVFGSDSAVIRAEGTLAMVETPGGQAERLGGTVGSNRRTLVQDLAPGDPVVGR
jgi:hypothetical protein